MPIVLLISACAGPEVTSGIYDPFEENNRRVHEDNRAIDKAFLRPASNIYGEGLPEEIRIGVGNFASNLTLPGSIINDVLQLNIEDAIHNTVRLLVNTTVGLGGILDPASGAGVEARDSDFGETLHVWGFQEGAYVELPFMGPSTTRDAVGIVVDLFIDPLGHVLPADQKLIAPAASAASLIGNRYRFGTTFDSILYDSADSYAQSRLLYLENRRFQLGIDTNAADDELYDIYEEAYE